MRNKAGDHEHTTGPTVNTTTQNNDKNLMTIKARGLAFIYTTISSMKSRKNSAIFFFKFRLVVAPNLELPTAILR